MSLLDIPQDLAARLKKFRFRKTQDIACEVYEIKELEEGSRKELVFDEEFGDIEDIQAEVGEDLPDFRFLGGSKISKKKFFRKNFKKIFFRKIFEPPPLDPASSTYLTK